MTVLFSNNVGKISVLTDQTANAMLSLANISPDKGARLSDLAGDIILTKISSDQQTNTQFLNTIGGSVYLYVFGDRVGQVTLGGLCFDNDCGNNWRHGVENIISWYERNRVSNTRPPMNIYIGVQTVFKGHLLSLSVDGSDAASRVVSFKAVFAVLPTLNKVVAPL